MDWARVLLLLLGAVALVAGISLLIELTPTIVSALGWAFTVIGGVVVVKTVWDLMYPPTTTNVFVEWGS